MDVAWTIPALGDLDEIQNFVAQDSPIAAFRLIDDLIVRAESLLTDNPMIGRKGRVSGTRELVMPPMPYIVVYRVTSGIEIIAVVHGAREWPRKFS